MSTNLTTASAADVVGGPHLEARPSAWRRLLDALYRSRQRAAEREVERFLRLHGGTLTDDLEREISRRFGHRVGG